ncbi:Uncharacterised protein [Mycobacteroides abscessus subsp. abscessus]|nr:Uncharacterised protein [Mycobacteroides abscessus subsp. abscessus]
MLEPHVEEQRPFAVLADLDQPRLERVVLLIGHLLLEDEVVERLDRLPGEQSDPLMVDDSAGRPGLTLLEPRRGVRPGIRGPGGDLFGETVLRHCCSSSVTSRLCRQFGW